MKIRSQRGLDDVYEIFGRSPDGAYLHAVYRLLDGDRLRVFDMAPMTERQRSGS